MSCDNFFGIMSLLIFRITCVNYENPNMNIGMPVFSIHGNHDDPTGVSYHVFMQRCKPIFLHLICELLRPFTSLPFNFV